MSHQPRNTTVARTQALISPLSPDEGSLPADASWLFQRAKEFMAVTGVKFHLWLSPELFRRQTGEDFHSGQAGAAYLGPYGARWAVPVVVLNLHWIPDRRTADQVMAHEFMHVKWPSYGHKAVAFSKAQAVLDALGRHGGRKP